MSKYNDMVNKNNACKRKINVLLFIALAAVAEWQTHLTQNQAGNRAGSSPASGILEEERRFFPLFYFVPKILSPASPSPGQIYAFSFNSRSKFPT